MTSQTHQGRSAYEEDERASPSGSISAAVTASARGLNRADLESALMDASLFGHLAYHAFCNLGFEKLDPPRLNQKEGELVYWSISQLSSMIDEAKAVFYEANARKGASS